MSATVRLIRCPRCQAKGSDLYLKEHWRDSTIEFDIDDNGTISMEGVKKEGDPYKVVGHCCICGHAWTIRGVFQITQLHSGGAQ